MLDLSLLRNWQFHSIAVALVLLVRLTNKLAKGLEHVFRSNKYKNSFWKFGQEDPQLSAERGRKNFILTAIACKLVVGFGNKLADDLEHVLGLKKCKKSFGKLGRDAAHR